MNRFLAAAALLTLLFHGAAASAAEATGWITHLDAESDRFYLDDGRDFGVSEDINFSSLSDGVRVRIRYDTFGEDRIASDIVLAPATPPLAATPHSEIQHICSKSGSAALNSAVSQPDPAFC